MTTGNEAQSTDVLYTVDGAIATITINRPERLNAFTPDTVRALDLGGEPSRGRLRRRRDRGDRCRQQGLLRRR